MKKLLKIGTVALVVVSFISCKKTYTCVCVYKGISAAHYISSTTTVTGTTKSKAQAACNATAKVVADTLTANCEIK